MSRWIRVIAWAAVLGAALTTAGEARPKPTAAPAPLPNGAEMIVTYLEASPHYHPPRVVDTPSGTFYYPCVHGASGTVWAPSQPCNRGNKDYFECWLEGEGHVAYRCVCWHGAQLHTRLSPEQYATLPLLVRRAVNYSTGRPLLTGRHTVTTPSGERITIELRKPERGVHMESIQHVHGGSGCIIGTTFQGFHDPSCYFADGVDPDVSENGCQWQWSGSGPITYNCGHTVLMERLEYSPGDFAQMARDLGVHRHSGGGK